MAVSKATLLEALKKARVIQDGRNEDKFVQKVDGKGLSTNDYTNEEKAKLAGIEAGAQVNVIESVKVNGAAQTVTEKAVDVTVPTRTSDITNDSDYRTGAEVEAAINAKIASAYKAGGTKEAADLTSALLVAANEGKVYNMSEEFTTTADFVEGAGKTFPEGTDVSVINTGTEASPVFKFNVMAGFVDLSDYVEKETGKGLSTNDFTNTYKGNLDTLWANRDEQISDAEIAAIFVDG